MRKDNRFCGAQQLLGSIEGGPEAPSGCRRLSPAVAKPSVQLTNRSNSARPFVTGWDGIWISQRWTPLPRFPDKLTLGWCQLPRLDGKSVGAAIPGRLRFKSNWLDLVITNLNGHALLQEIYCD